MKWQQKYYKTYTQITIKTHLLTNSYVQTGLSFCSDKSGYTHEHLGRVVIISS